MASSYYPSVSQDVTIASTVVSTTSTNAFGPTTTNVRLLATVACYVNFGPNPTAIKPGGMRLARNLPEYFGVAPGMKVAVLPDVTAAGGTLTVTELCG